VKLFGVLAAGVMCLGAIAFFAMMVASILTGQGDYKYDALMGMLCANLGMSFLVASRVVEDRS
jgi:hypothetical protein